MHMQEEAILGLDLCWSRAIIRRQTLDERSYGIIANKVVQI